MRANYDFSRGVRGKYVGTVGASNVRVCGAPVETNPERGLNAGCELDGEIRKKRGDTLLRTLRKAYGPAFAPGVRSDMRLDTLRKRVGGESLSKLLKK